MAEIKQIGGFSENKRKDGTFQTGYTVYDKEGVCPTIPTCAGGGIQPKVIEEKKNGFFEKAVETAEKGNAKPGDIIDAFNGRVIKDGISPTITTRPEGKKTAILPCVKVKQATKEGTISERQNSIKAKRLPNGNIRFYRDDEKKSAVSELQVQSGADVVQTITVANVPKIYKEEQVEIKQATKEGSIKCKVGGCYDASYPDSKTRRGRVQDNGDTVPTLTASSSENINYIETVYRIRKLTPKECFRLMGYTDRDFEQAAKVNSNSQLYKQAGNAIVKQVLMAIFLQMNIQGLPKWNDTH